MESFYTRLRAAAGDAPIEEIAARTATCATDVRRILDGAAITPAFLAEFCRQFGISAEWLLHGVGPMKRSDLKRFAILQARGSDSLQSLACESDRLSRRVDDLETLIAKADVLLRLHTEANDLPPEAIRTAPST